MTTARNAAEALEQMESVGGGGASAYNVAQWAGILRAALARQAEPVAVLQRGLEEERTTISALLEVAEQAVDTSRCSVGILRAMNAARVFLAAAPGKEKP